MKYHGIQSLRGFASLAVVIHHLDVLISKEKYFGEPLLGFLAASGFRGVDLFFVISGFIMMHTRTRNPERTRTDFAINRIIRIFLPYLPVFLVLSVAYAFMPSIAQGGINIDAWFIVQNLFLLPRLSLETYVPVVAWTLTFELTFYIIFALTILKPGRLSTMVFTVWMALCFLNIWIESPLMILNPLNLGFGIGVVSYMGLRYIPKSSGNLLFITSCLAFLALMWVGGERHDNNLVNIVFLIVSGFMCMTSKYIPRNVLAWIGDYSYSLYLCHYPILALLFIVAFKVNPGINILALSATSIIISLIASWVYYHATEIYLCGLFKTKKKKAVTPV